MQTIHIQQWNKEKFFSAREQWSDLMNRSSADPLFLSWEWQSNWWHFFSDKTMTLRLYVATTDDGQLVGIAPLYSSPLVIKKIVKLTRLQFIGNCWRGKSTMPTEHLAFITDKNWCEEVNEAFYEHLHTLKFWDEIVLPFLNVQSKTYQQLSNHPLFSRHYLRHAEKYKSYYLNISDQFQGYIKNLGKNTRLKLYNRRKNLQQLGEIKYQTKLTNNIEQQFTLLNELHEKRWGKPAFKDERLSFNIKVAELMAAKNYLNFSVITLNDNPVSIQYNYVINKHNYNIQAGFNETLHNKISLGYLHFGYEIEASFDWHYTRYDFLAGEGKNTQYKKHLTSDYLQIVDLQIIRQPLLKILYQLYDKIKPRD